MVPGQMSETLHDSTTPNTTTQLSPKRFNFQREKERKTKHKAINERILELPLPTLIVIII